MNIGMTVSFSGTLPYNLDVRFLVIGSLLLLETALYMHVYGMWRTIRCRLKAIGLGLEEPRGLFKCPANEFVFALL